MQLKRINNRYFYGDAITFLGIQDFQKYKFLNPNVILFPKIILFVIVAMRTWFWNRLI